MCKCNNIEVGTYKNTCMLTNQNGKKITVDRCLEDEIKHLWSLGIETNGCCCGHNKIDPYIGVYDEHIDHMKDLGYVVYPNNHYPESENEFYAKTIKK